MSKFQFFTLAKKKTWENWLFLTIKLTKYKKFLSKRVICQIIQFHEIDGSFQKKIFYSFRWCSHYLFIQKVFYRFLSFTQNRQRLIDGTNVVQEVLSDNATGSSNATCVIRGRGMEEGGPGPETPHPGHHDTISSLAMSNACILTGSTDGLIQVWK